MLYLDHPRKKIRDTSRYRPFRRLFQGKTPSLKKLSDKVLGVTVQEGEHDSVRIVTCYSISRTCLINGPWGLMGINNLPLSLMEIYGD